MPYKLHSRFCNPCLSPCTIGCESNCSSAESQRNGFNVIHFKLTGLKLIPSSFNAPPNGTLSSLKKSDNLISYYLQVKVVNYAGQETVGVSKGIMVDLTPPKFQSVTCIDPSYSMDEPSDYQGTTTSVGAYWECEEDVSEIIDYTLGIGTKPGVADVYIEEEKDIKKKEQRDLRKKRALNGLEHLLQRKHTYYVIVIATNNAGLKANMSCNITIDTDPPVVKNILSKLVGTYKSFSDGDPASLLEDSNHIEINWSGGPKEIAFYGKE